ncbi:MAG: hypothetical protein BGN94_19455 [Rhizobiales bacterium 68-8]|nr:MAG: hypothetical protein BGN94_19455 [Rhizobiales bacterium 68-8]
MRGPAASTIAIWTTKKATSSSIAAKWMVRAVWRPPNSSGSQGAAELKPGDIDRPVAIISGKSTNSTPK